LASLGLEPLSAATGNNKRRKSGREAGRKVVDKRPRSLRLKEVVKSRGSATESEGKASVVNPIMAMKISFCHVVTQFERFHPAADDDSGKRGRFKLARHFADGMKQYMADGCPPLPAGDGKWDYVVKALNFQQRTTRSETQEQQVHRLMHLPKKTKFAGAQIVPSKCEYPQFACRGGCLKRVRTYCSCSPGIIICNVCFVRHTIEKEAETASDFYANEGEAEDESDA